MDEDGHGPERLWLPKSFAESGDPIEGNPYPTGHPARRVFRSGTGDPAPPQQPERATRLATPC